MALFGGMEMAAVQMAAAAATDPKPVVNFFLTA